MERLKFQISQGPRCVLLEADTPQDLEIICHNFALILKLKNYDFAETVEVMRQQAAKEAVKGTPFAVNPSPIGYGNGYIPGHRVEVIQGSMPRIYNTHINLMMGARGTVDEKPNPDFPSDAVQVRFDDGGRGAVDVGWLRIVGVETRNYS